MKGTTCLKYIVRVSLNDSYHDLIPRVSACRGEPGNKADHDQSMITAVPSVTCMYGMSVSPYNHASYSICVHKHKHNFHPSVTKLEKAEF